MSDDRAVERHGEDEAVIRAAVAGAAAKRDVHIAVGDGERAALLLDPPIEGCRRRDDGAELGHARRQVQALEPVDIVGAERGRIDAVARDVDDRCAEDALRRDVAADPPGGGRGTEVLEPDRGTVLLVDCVDGVVEGRDVDHALVDEGLGVNRGVEGAGNPTGGRAGGGGLCGVEARVGVVAVVDGPRAVGHGRGLWGCLTCRSRRRRCADHPHGRQREQRAGDSRQAPQLPHVEPPNAVTRVVWSFCAAPRYPTPPSRVRPGSRTRG